MGLARSQWNELIRNFCDELIGSGGATGQALRGASLRRLLDEVTDPRLRRLVSAMSTMAADADRLVDASEAALLDAMETRWNLEPRSRFRPTRQSAGRGGPSLAPVGTAQWLLPS